jgi:hypothetical protein
MTIYSAIVWLNIFFAAQPFLFGMQATGFHIFNACVALWMIWRAPIVN